jgi:hypothetical protein
LGSETKYSKRMAVGSAKRVEISILPVIAVAQYPCTKNAQEPNIETTS